MNPKWKKKMKIRWLRIKSFRRICVHSVFELCEDTFLPSFFKGFKLFRLLKTKQIVNNKYKLDNKHIVIDDYIRRYFERWNVHVSFSFLSLKILFSFGYILRLLLKCCKSVSVYVSISPSTDARLNRLIFCQIRQSALFRRSAFSDQF